MKNQMQGNITVHILFDTDFSVEEFLVKFHEDNVVGGKLKLIISDGSTHVMDVCRIEKEIVTNFFIDGEELEYKKEVTELENPVTKIY